MNACFFFYFAAIERVNYSPKYSKNIGIRKLAIISEVYMVFEGGPFGIDWLLSGRKHSMARCSVGSKEAMNGKMEDGRTKKPMNEWNLSLIAPLKKSFDWKLSLSFPFVSGKKQSIRPK